MVPRVCILSRPVVRGGCHLVSVTGTISGFYSHHHYIIAARTVPSNATEAYMTSALLGPSIQRDRHPPLSVPPSQLLPVLPSTSRPDFVTIVTAIVLIVLLLGCAEDWACLGPPSMEGLANGVTSGPDVLIRRPGSRFAATNTSAPTTAHQPEKMYSCLSNHPKQP